jgi:hypothetical protein
VLTILQERAHLTPEIRRAATNDFSILLEDAGGARAVFREAVEAPEGLIARPLVSYFGWGLAR